MIRSKRYTSSLKRAGINQNFWKYNIDNETLKKTFLAINKNEITEDTWEAFRTEVNKLYADYKTIYRRGLEKVFNTLQTQYSKNILEQMKKTLKKIENNINKFKNKEKLTSNFQTLGVMDQKKDIPKYSTRFMQSLDNIYNEIQNFYKLESINKTNIADEEAKQENISNMTIDISKFKTSIKVIDTNVNMLKQKLNKKYNDITKQSIENYQKQNIDNIIKILQKIKDDVITLQSKLKNIQGSQIEEVILIHANIKENINECMTKLQNTQNDIQNFLNDVDKMYEKAKTTFQANKEILAKRGIKLDEFENVAKISSNAVDKINEYTKEELTKASLLALSPIYIYNLWYIMKSKTLSLFDTFIYQLNKLYGDEFSYYEFFLIVFFIMLVLIVGIILYWDNVYRTAKKLSRCRQIGKIADQNRNVDKHPFVYVIMIINESNLDGVLDKYVLKLEYNFVKKTTNAILGESEYVNEVKLIEENIPNTQDKIKNITSKEDAYNTAFTNYDAANKKYPYNVSTDICNKLSEKTEITNCSDKLIKQDILAAAEGALNGAKDILSAELSTHWFSYFDLAKMQSKKLENINKNLITDRKYKYVCMTPDNKILNTEIARELSTFVRDFGMNDKTSTYPIYNVLNAVQQKV
jgi:hypothetical protein